MIRCNTGSAGSQAYWLALPLVSSGAGGRSLRFHLWFIWLGSQMRTWQSVPAPLPSLRMRSQTLLGHARAGHVKWRCAGVYSVAGILGALIGSSIGKLVDGQKLLMLFAFLMIFVGVLMFRKRGSEGNPGAQCSRENVSKVAGFGGMTEFSPVSSASAEAF